MFCQNCGNQLKEGAKFCTGCGTHVEIPMNEAVQGSSLPPTQQPIHANSQVETKTFSQPSVSVIPQPPQDQFEHWKPTAKQPVGNVSYQYEKANLIVRWVAMVIDFFPSIMLCLIPILGGLATFVYDLIKDGLFEGQSVGKKIMGLQVIVLDSGQPAAFADSAKRNIPFAIPAFIEIIPFIGFFIGLIVLSFISFIETIALLVDPDGRRIGDKIAGTMVITKRR